MDSFRGPDGDDQLGSADESNVQLSAVRRTLLHARIAESLEELYGPGAEAHAAEIAYHLLEGRATSERVARYLLLAGEHALDTYAYREAHDLFRSVLTTKAGGSASQRALRRMDTEAAEALFGLGRSQLGVLERNQTESAIASLRRAFDYYVKLGETAKAVAVAQFPLPPLPGLAGGTRIVPRALELVPSESIEAARLLASYAPFRGVNDGDYTSSHSDLKRALTIARREGDAGLEIQALANLARVAGMHLLGKESAKASQRAVEIASIVDNPSAEADARFWAAEIALHYKGDPKAAARDAAAGLAPAEKLGDRYRLANALWSNEGVARLTGDWRNARAFSDRCLSVAPHDPRMIFTRSLIEQEQGEFVSGEKYLGELLAAMREAAHGPNLEYATAAIAIPMLARIRGAEPQASVAEEAAEAVLSSPSALPVLVAQARAGLALLAVHRGDPGGAEQQYVALKAMRGTMVRGIVVVDRVLALTALTFGRSDLAFSHFRDSLAFCARAGYRPEYSWCAYEYSSALLENGVPGTRRRAISLLGEASAIAEELTMSPLAGKVAALNETLELGQHDSKLSAREAQVLRRIADGETNREIADDLSISPNTVLHHVTHILAKTGSANRAEAAAYAATRNLISP